MAQETFLGMMLKSFLPGLLAGGSNTTTFDAKDQALMEVKRKAGSVTVVVGTRETGCTTLCLRLAEFFGRPTYAVSPQETPPYWVKSVTLSEALSIIPENSTLILDDLPVYMGHRDYNETDVKRMEKAIPMVRHEKHPPEFLIGKVHLIFRTQSLAEADKYIGGCDLAFFKPQGLLTADMERNYAQRIYRKEVNPYFAGRSHDFILKHAWMKHQMYCGPITITKPNNEGHEVGWRPQEADKPRSAPETIIID